MKTKAMIVTVIALVLAVVIGVVSAQDGGRPHRGNRGGHGGLDMMLDMADIVTNATGLTMQEIRQQVADGATLAAVIEANGGSVDAVIAEAMTVIEERVAEAQENGSITEERAAQVLENLEQRLTDAVNGTGGFMGRGGGMMGNWGERGFFAPHLAQAVAAATGLEAQDILIQVQGGASLASILTDNDVDVDTFVAEQTTQYEERLTTLVEEGRISQAVADARLNLFNAELADRLNRIVETETE
jgi:hypothetical protein